MFGIFSKLQDIAERLGTIEEAHMYPDGSAVINVNGSGGKSYRISVFTQYEEVEE